MIAATAQGTDIKRRRGKGSLQRGVIQFDIMRKCHNGGAGVWFEARQRGVGPFKNQLGIRKAFSRSVALSWVDDHHLKARQTSHLGKWLRNVNCADNHQSVRVCKRA